MDQPWIEWKKAAPIGIAAGARMERKKFTISRVRVRARARAEPRRIGSTLEHPVRRKRADEAETDRESIAMSTEAEKSGGAPAPVRCQRIGCDAMFTEDDNPDGSCHYHPSGPIFHDGMKEWSCCKQRSHDFSLFLAIPGCTTGNHTTEKPVTKAVSANPPKAAPIQSFKQGVGTDACSRCHQGFFCSDHGSQPKAQKPAATNGTNTEPVEKPSVPPPKKKIDLNEPRICKNKGCGKTFKEKDNHDAACQYHPGPAVFHDRMRGWKCCDIHVKEFDEFMEIPPCTKGWHNADAA